MATHSPTTPGPRAVNAALRPSADRRATVIPDGDTPPRRALRRRFLLEAGATIAASLGVTAAVLSPDPVWGAPATDAGPDAELIAACDRFTRAMRAYNADRSGLDSRLDPLWAELTTAEDEAQAIPARTLAGAAAKARVAMTLGTQPDGTVRMGDSYTGAWPEEVVRDVLRLAGIEVPA